MGGFEKLQQLCERITTGWEMRSIVSAILVWLFGDFNAALGALITLWAFDWITKWIAIARANGGFVNAWQTDAINSHKMRDGLNKTVCYIIFLIMARQLEQFSLAGYTLGKSTTEFAAAYLALIEAKSILENLRDSGWQESGPLIAILGRKQEQVAGQMVGLNEQYRPYQSGLLGNIQQYQPKQAVIDNKYKRGEP